MEKYGASPEVFAKVAVKTRKHAAVNPYALFTDLLTVEEVMNAPNVYLDYLTRLMACPPTCGAGAAIVCSEEFAKRHSVEGVVEIAGQSMTTDTPTTWQDPISLIGADMTRRAARAVYDESGLGPEDVDVVELHDCFTVNEVVTYEGLGLCGEGEAPGSSKMQITPMAGRLWSTRLAVLCRRGTPWVQPGWHSVTNWSVRFEVTRVIAR